MDGQAQVDGETNVAARQLVRRAVLPSAIGGALLGAARGWSAWPADAPLTLGPLVLSGLLGVLLLGGSLVIAAYLFGRWMQRPEPTAGRLRVDWTAFGMAAFWWAGMTIWEAVDGVAKARAGTAPAAELITEGLAYAIIGLPWGLAFGIVMARLTKWAPATSRVRRGQN